MQTEDSLRSIVFRVRKQWDYCCQVLICMVKTTVHSLHFTPTAQQNMKIMLAVGMQLALTLLSVLTKIRAHKETHCSSK